MKGPKQQTKSQRDSTLDSATRKSGNSPKRQHLQKVHSGSTRKGSKQMKKGG